MYKVIFQNPFNGMSEIFKLFVTEEKAEKFCVQLKEEGYLNIKVIKL